MTDETSGNPRPQEKHIHGASNLLRRARFNPRSAKHVQNIGKAATKGHPGAKLAQAAIAEARKREPAPPPPIPLHVRSAAFPSWARGAA